MKTRLYLVAAIILLTGLGSSALISFTARNEAGGGSGYEEAGGDIYTVRPGDSKIYRHDLQVYGGKANVVMDEFMRWFDGLWRGKSLAFTIICITVFIAFGSFLLGYHWKPDLESRTEDGKRDI
jgi:hypothetical protein